MTSEARNDNTALQTLTYADKSVRDAIAKYGSQSQEVVSVLAQYAALLREFGYEEQAQRVNERVRLMREALGKRASEEFPMVQPEESRLHASAPSPSPAEETHLFNSRGEHVAVAWNDNLYTPSGKHIGRWAADLEVYLDRSGNYLGIVAEENRLVCDHNWQYRNINFGDRGNEGNRPGWTKQRDIEPIALPKWLSDVSLPTGK
jgi:hypothetical protein